MQKTLLLKLLFATITLSIVAVACSPGTSTEAPSTPTGESPPAGLPTAIPTDMPNPPAAIPIPELRPDAQLVLPPLIFAIDESRSMVLSGCDQERMRYRIPKFLIDVFADMQDPRRFTDQSSVIEPSSISLYYLDQYAITTQKTRLSPNYEGSFASARKDDFWSLTDRNSGNANYVYLFDEMFYEYKELLRSTKQPAETPWLIFFTDGYFDDKREEAVSTKRELREILQYENARILIYLICPQKYKDDYPGVEDYWLQRASESNGKIVVLGREGDREGVVGLMSSLLSQVDGYEPKAMGWGALEDGKTSIAVPADTLYLRMASDTIHTLGGIDFEPPTLDFDDREDSIPSMIFPNRGCGDHTLDIFTAALQDEFAFYWWNVEQIRFGAELKEVSSGSETSADPKIPFHPYVYNDDNFNLTAKLSIINIIGDKVHDEGALSECYEARLKIDNTDTGSPQAVRIDGEQQYDDIPYLQKVDKVDKLSYQLDIYRKNSDAEKYLYQSSILKGDIDVRYFPKLPQPPLTGGMNCQTLSNTTTCNMELQVDFLADKYYEGRDAGKIGWWVPTIDVCGEEIVAELENLSGQIGDLVRAARSKEKNVLKIQLNSLESYETDGCDSIKISWDYWENTDGWQNPTPIICTLDWSNHSFTCNHSAE